MPDVTQKTYADVVSGQAAAVQATSSGLQDFSLGSLPLAIAEAVANVVMWLQGLVLTLLAITRAATSTGSDLDSWVGDFGLVRLAATQATGAATFSRFSTGSQSLVPIGTTLQSTDGTQSFTVTVDTTNAAYNAGLGAYVLAPSASSVTVPIQAVTAGSAGNVVAGFVSVLTTPIPYIDTVSNALALSGGAGAETDAALRARFINYVASLAKGTVDSTAFAIQSLGPQAWGVVIENQTYAGTSQPGFFCVIADDGTGSPSGAFLTNAANAVEAQRPLTSTFAVYAPVATPANISVNVSVAAGYNSASVTAAIVSAFTAYVSGLDQQWRANPRLTSITLSYNKLIQLAYDASPGVVAISALLVNGGTSDITAAVKQTITVGTITATPV